MLYFGVWLCHIGNNDEKRKHLSTSAVETQRGQEGLSSCQELLVSQMMRSLKRQKKTVSVWQNYIWLLPRPWQRGRWHNAQDLRQTCIDVNSQFRCLISWDLSHLKLILYADPSTVNQNILRTNSEKSHDLKKYTTLKPDQVMSQWDELREEKV